MPTLRSLPILPAMLIACAAMITPATATADDHEEGPEPVRVYIMMGQSNMLGFGRPGPADSQGTLQNLIEQHDQFEYMVDEDGEWAVREDVRYVFVMQHRGNMRENYNGWLTINGRFGPEMGFGHVVGEAHDQPVLLLKSCIGNRSLGWDLLPPDSESFTWTDNSGTEWVYAGYGDSPLRWEAGTEPERIGWYAGKQYDDDVANAQTVLANLEDYYPGYEGQGYEVAGFVWWQGHKDQNPAHAGRYEQNLDNLIDQLRISFDSPEARFVCSTIAFGGDDLSGPGLTIAEAQLNIADYEDYPEHEGNVAAIDARPLWRDADVSPSGQGYHYNHNAYTYMMVGEEMGRAMVEMEMDNEDDE